MQRKIIHIDMDCFYAAIEERENPSLQGQPVAVGGWQSQRGVLCTANYIAREYGVRAAMPTAHAYRLCPDLVVVPPQFPLYREVSNQIKDIFQAYTDGIEPIALDEAYLDLTENNQHHGSAFLTAQAIREAIYKNQGLTASAGISVNKFLAKVASDWQKPNGQHLVAPIDIEAFMLMLPIKRIPGVGPRTLEKFQKLNLETCGQLQQVPLEDLIKQFGAFGVKLYERCRGIDLRDVESSRERKSLSAEHTFEQDLKSFSEIQQHIPDMYETLCVRLKKAGIDNPKKIFIKIKFHDFTQTTKEQACQVLNLASIEALFKEGFDRHQKPVRLLGCGVRIEPAKNQTEQMTLF